MSSLRMPVTCRTGDTDLLLPSSLTTMLSYSCWWFLFLSGWCGDDDLLDLELRSLLDSLLRLDDFSPDLVDFTGDFLLFSIVNIHDLGLEVK